MNKKQLSIYLLLFCSHLAYAQPYNGLYFGSAAGLTTRTSSVRYMQSYSSNNPADPSSAEFIDNTERDNNTNAIFNLYGGYGYMFGQIYFGLEAGIGADLSHMQRTNSVPGADGDAYLVRTTFARDLFYRFALRLGVLFRDATLLSFNPGFEFSRYRFQHFTPGVTTFGVIYTPSPLFSYSRIMNTFAPTIALEKFCNNVIFRFEYGHDFGSKITRVFTYNGFGVTPTATYLYNLTDLKHIRLHANFVKVGVAYNFS